MNEVVIPRPMWGLQGSDYIVLGNMRTRKHIPTPLVAQNTYIFGH